MSEPRVDVTSGEGFDRIKCLAKGWHRIRCGVAVVLDRLSPYVFVLDRSILIGFVGRTFPVYFCTGFATGLAYEQGNNQVNQMNEKLRQDAIEAAKKLSEAHPDLSKIKKQL